MTPAPLCRSPLLFGLLGLFGAALAPTGCGRIGFVPQSVCVGAACRDGSVVDAALGDAGPRDAADLDGGDLDGGVAAPDSGPIMWTDVDVEATYPAFGRDINQYVIRSDLGRDGSHQSDSRCLGNERGARACIHGGERRRVPLAGAVSCAGMILRDSLAAFEWRCEVEGGEVLAYSTALREEVGLAQLIDASAHAFRPIAFTAVQGGRGWRSAPSSWWSNPIVEAPANSDVGAPVEILAAGGSPPTIYVVSTSRATSGYLLSGAGVGFVVGEGVELSHNGSGLLNCEGGTRTCMIMGSGNFLWIEGSFSSDSRAGFAHRLVQIDGMHSGTVRKVTVVGGVRGASAQPAISVRGAYSSRFEHLRARYTNDIGVELRASLFNDLYDVRLVGPRAIYAYSLVEESRFNVTRRLHNIGEMVWIYSAYNVLVESAATQGSEYAMRLEGNSVSVNVLAANVDRSGFELRNGHLLVNALSHNHGDDGVYLHTNSSIGRNFVAHVASSGNDRYGYAIGIVGTPPTGTSSFFGTLAVGPNVLGACLAGDSSPLDSACLPLSGAWPMVRADIDVGAALVGRVASDSLNGSEAAAPVPGSAIADADWFRFEHWLRAFGRTELGGAATLRGRCQDSGSDGCVVRDYRLRATDTGVRGVHGAPMDGMPCPASVSGDGDEASGTVLSVTFRFESAGDGDQICESAEACTNEVQRFLANALEIRGDEVGDEDGLCESNERCIFSPNLGPYQGEGDFEAHRCTFTSGDAGTGVANVEMHFYPSNGI